MSLSITPAEGTSQVRLDAPVSVTADGGTLQSVTVATTGGEAVAGDLDAAKTSWKSSQALASGATYTVTVTAAGASGTPTTKTSTFTTLTPKATVELSSMLPNIGWVVGVGMPIIVEFTKSVTNKDAAVKALSVTTTPTVEGAWRWESGKQIQWRPQNYWPTGTKVSVTAAIAGVELSPGVWGKGSKTHTFTVGSAMISTVDVKTDMMTVRRDGNVIKTIPITTGRPTDKLRTRNGIKVIISRETTHQMDSATTGVSQDSPEYYNLTVHYAMRVTWSGEFLHAAPWSVASQGHANVSHGCTGMSDANAKWMFANSKVGDVVIYTGSPRKLEWGNGYTAWNMPYAQWAAGA